MKTNKYEAPFLQKKIIFTIAISFVFFFTIFKTDIFAASPLSIGTAPTSEYLELQPGETYNGELVVWNLSGLETNYELVVRGFKQIENQPGTAIMLTEEQNERALYSASSWIEIDETEILLEPNRNEKIYYSITVPEDATEGEYNAILAFLSQRNEKNQGTAALTTLSSGMPILIKIGDDFLENAELLKFTTDKSFYEIPTIQFSTSIKNLGDTHITPMGEIVLTNIFGQELARIPFNPNGQSILRDNSGNYQTIWDYGKFLTEDNGIILGPIQAQLITTYRSFQPGFSPLTATTSFWVLPWKYIVGFLIILITLIVIIRQIKKKKAHTYTPMPK
jgi:hypothetical protein